MGGVREGEHSDTEAELGMVEGLGSTTGLLGSRPVRITFDLNSMALHIDSPGVSKPMLQLSMASSPPALVRKRSTSAVQVAAMFSPRDAALCDAGTQASKDFKRPRLASPEVDAGCRVQDIRSPGPMVSTAGTQDDCILPTMGRDAEHADLHCISAKTVSP